MSARQPLLYYFTASFPYGLGELWKLNELDVLKDSFDRIVIAPFTYAGNRHARPVPERCEVLQPLFPSLSGLRGKLPLIFTGGRLGFYLRELVSSRAFRRRRWLQAWAIASIQIEVAMRSRQVRDLLRQPRETVIYFFWAREWAYVAPLLREQGFKRLFARFHGYDLYEERSDNAAYIPYRKPLLSSLKGAILLSESARDYLAARYPEIRSKTAVIPLGVRRGRRARPSADGRLRIVSCSNATPVKRLHLIAETLMLAQRPIHWTHIGDGPMLADLKQRSGRLPELVEVDFLGAVQPDQVQPLYASRAFDLFVNVSESEGMPVSILEAMAAGIPVVATDVGGTAELVSKTTGILLPAEFHPSDLHAAMEQFAAMTPGQILAMRSAARALVAERFDASRNARRLATLLAGEDGRIGP